MNKLTVGIIGAGYWGPNLIRNFAACAATEVVGICDASPQRLDGIRKSWGHLPLVSTVEQLLDLKPQAVALATPVSTHFPIAKRCLEAGLHVLVEKPLAANVQEAEALVALAEKHKRVLMVDHTYLFGNPVKLIKKLVDRGELGELYYVDSIRINLGLFQKDVNVIWDLAPHDLSIVDHVVNQAARSISAWGCAHTDSDMEDMAYVNVDYGDHMLANFHVNWLSPVKVRQMIFAGSKKSLIFNELNTTEPVKVYDRGIELGEVRNAEERRRLLVGYRSGDVWSPQVEPGEALQGVVSHFALCVREDTTPISDGRLGLRLCGRWRRRRGASRRRVGA
jgi:predicted dehydrogenase